MTLAAGTKLGRYEVESAIGAGGMGEVYRAKDTRLGREVAIKVLPESFAVDVERLRRFEQEARATGAGQPRTLDLGQLRSGSMPGWMPGGKQLIFAGNDGHEWRIYLQDVNDGKMSAVTPAVRVEPEMFEPTSVSPSGKFVFGRDLEGKAWLYPLDLSKPEPVAGIDPSDLWIGWSSDGNGGFICPREKIPAEIYRLDLKTGKRQLVAQAAPGDATGLSDIILGANYAGWQELCLFVRSRCLRTLRCQRREMNRAASHGD